MLAITHLVTALAVGSSPLLLGLTCNYDTVALSYFAAISLGALIVDIDEPGSAIGRKIPIVSHFIKDLFGHRTVTHNLLLAVTGMALSLFVFDSYPAFGLFLGMAVHIIGDGMTGNVKGALAPFRSTFYVLPRSWVFRVGSATEYLVLTLATGLLSYEHILGVQEIFT